MLVERQRYSDPPYVRLLRITLRDTEVARLVKVSTLLGDRLRQRFGRRVLGPVSPLIDRIRREHRVEIMLKIENGRSMARARELLREALAQFGAEKEFKTINIAVDVDAQ